MTQRESDTSNERLSKARPGDEIRPGKYRKKPVVIEAIRWCGTNLKEVIDFTGLHPSAHKWTWEEYEAVVAKDGFKIFTLEGAHMVSDGDYVIKGVKGEFYACKPDIFWMTYERADTTPRPSIAASIGKDARIVCEMLELGDNRLLASDGPAGGQLPDLSPDEWGKVYRACKRIVKAAPQTSPSVAPADSESGSAAGSASAAPSHALTSTARSFPICKDHTDPAWNQPEALDGDEEPMCILCRLFYLEAQESLLEEWQQRAKRAEDAIKEMERPLDAQMARLNATVERLNGENEKLRASGVSATRRSILEEAYAEADRVRRNAAVLKKGASLGVERDMWQGHLNGADEVAYSIRALIDATLDGTAKDK